MRTHIIAILVCALVYGMGCVDQQASCEEPEENVARAQVQAPLNPNGDTELALVMRKMYEDGMVMKAAILEGEIPEGHFDLSKLYSQDAAEPDKVASDKYKAYGAILEAANEALINGEGAEKVAAYKAIVNSCTACHQAMCPGPLVKIKKMEVGD